MKHGSGGKMQNDSALTNLLEYLMISGVLLILMVIMLLLVNTYLMEGPANRLIYTEFTDIGNGVSTRMVDVYAIAPNEGRVFTKFDIPDDIVGRGYFVKLGTETAVNSTGQFILVYRGNLQSNTTIAGIAASKSASGSTTGTGLNTICYNSSGITEGVKC
jgi:hypothetical protein